MANSPPPPPLQNSENNSDKKSNPAREEARWHRTPSSSLLAFMLPLWKFLPREHMDMGLCGRVSKLFWNKAHLPNPQVC